MLRVDKIGFRRLGYKYTYAYNYVHKYNYVIQSDKTSLIVQKYTHAYNGIYLLFCRCYLNSVSFIELRRIFSSYMVKFVLKYCVQKRVVKLERLKINSNFLWQ